MTPNVAYFFGDDAFAVDRAVDRLARALGGADGPLERWVVNGDDSPAGDDPDDESRPGPRPTTVDEIEARVLTAPLFGSGTLVVVRQPGSLVRGRPAAERIVSLIGSVPPGNGLVFSDVRADTRAPPTGASDQLSGAVRAAGGVVEEFRVPGRDAMDRWIAARAAELGITLGTGAARLLAERVGAYVREGDIDRRNQSLLANSELEKLALYRPNAVVERADVEALAPDAVPGSVWGFLDAVAARRARDATVLAERLLASGTPLPVLVSQLHRRIRELLDVRDRLASGTRAQELPRLLRMQPFRAQKLAEQAVAWTLPELEDALDGLLALDLETKGIAPEGHTMNVSDERAALGLVAWIAQRVARARARAG